MCLKYGNIGVSSFLILGMVGIYSQQRIMFSAVFFAEIRPWVE